MEIPPPKSASDLEDAWLTKWLIPLVMIGVLTWGAYLAFGAMANSGNRSLHPQLKGMIMLAGFVGFLGFWALMLRQRARRLAEDEDDEE